MVLLAMMVFLVTWVMAKVMVMEIRMVMMTTAVMFVIVIVTVILMMLVLWWCLW